MAVIAQTARGAVAELTRTVLSASDTLTYVPNTNQYLELDNNTAGSLTVVIKGSAPSAAFPVPGTGGTTIDLSTGRSIVIAASKTFGISLDSIAPYLAGTGVVTITGGTAIIATLTV
jgi:hypothetical protein